MIVIFVPFIQDIFDTGALTLTQMIVTFIAGSVVLFAVELEKVVIRRELEAEEVKIVESTT